MNMIRCVQMKNKKEFAQESETMRRRKYLIFFFFILSNKIILRLEIWEEESISKRELKNRTHIQILPVNS